MPIDPEALHDETQPLNSSTGSTVHGWGLLREKVSDPSELATNFEEDNGDGDKTNSGQWSDITTSHELTVRQCFLIYIILHTAGVIAYSFVFENWSVLDSLYFTTVLLTTVGYGDLNPTSTGGRLFVVVFALVGVVLIGLVLGVVGSEVVESHVSVNESMKGKAKSLFEKAFHVEEGAHPMTLGNLARATVCDSDSGDIDPVTEERYKGPEPASELKMTLLPAVVVIAVGGYLLSTTLHEEGESEWTAIAYFIVITATTVGFGDIVPKLDRAKLGAIFFIPLSVGAMGFLLGTVATTIINMKRDRKLKKLWSSELTIMDIKALDTDDDAGISEVEYLRFMLSAMNKVDEEKFDLLVAQFKHMDIVGDGRITKKDIGLAALRKLNTVSLKMDLAEYKEQLLKKGGKRKHTSLFHATGGMRGMFKTSDT